MHWHNVSSSHPCVICGRTDWCAYSADGRYSLCRRVFRSDGILKEDINGKEYYQYDHRPGDGPDRVYQIDFPVKKSDDAPTVARADPDLLNRVYRDLLQELPLTDAHREDLRRRGLSDDEIFRRGYKSWPAEGRKKICEKLREKHGINLLRVPGFYLKSDPNKGDGEWISLTGWSGLIIPVRDLQKRIIALRVRIDDTNEEAIKGGKYRWVSSAYHGGPGPGAPIHIPGWDGNLVGLLIRITEGELKADIATALSRIPTLSVPGVGNWKPLLPILKELQILAVRIAYDADASGKRIVASSLYDLAQALVHNGIMVELEIWLAESGKGIDDVLAAGGTAEVLSGNEAMDKIISIYEDAKRADPPPHERALAEARERIGDLNVRLDDPGFLADEGNLRALVTIRHSAASEWALRIKPILVKRHCYRETVAMLDDYEARMAAARNDHRPTNLNGKNKQGTDRVEVEGSERPSPRPDFGKSLTDLGNAERLVLAHQGDIRYCKEWGKWLIWNETRWVIDREDKVGTMALDVIRNIYYEAAECGDPDHRKAIFKHALQSEREHSVTSMLSLAQIIKGVSITQEKLDADPYLIGVKNGVVDLRTGELLEARREHFITKQAAVEYDLDAQYPLFEKFITTIFCGNENLIQFIQQAVGYSLTGDVSERCLFILHGTGKNGKSTLLDTVYTMMGDYAMRTPTETLMVKYYSGGIPNDIARLKGARFVSASESEEGQRLSESKIKDLTGNEMISARFMRAEFFDFRPEFKLWLSTNHKPTIHGTDNAIWDRIRLLPFEYRVSDSECDPNLLKKLKNEINGVFQWALAGCLKNNMCGLKSVEEVKKAVAGYREEMDVVGPFINDCLILDFNSETPIKDLYDEYCKWCEINAEKPLSKRRFIARLLERGLQQTRDKSTRYVKGAFIRYNF